MKNQKKLWLQSLRLTRSLNLFIIVTLSFLIAGCADDLMNPTPVVDINPGFSPSGLSAVSVVSQNESDVLNVVYSRVYGISRDLTVKLVVDEAALNAYNTANGTSYKLLPSKFYTMPSSTAFKDKSKNANFNITFKSKELYLEAGSVEDASRYVLPIKGVAENSDGVDMNEEQNTALIRINMQAATITTTLPDAPVNIYFVEESTAKETQIVAGTLNFNGLDINAISLVVDESADLLKDPQYTLLPKKNYSIGTPVITSDNKVNASVEFNAAGLEDGITYLLPCRLKSSSVHYVIAQSEPLYYIVNITGVKVSITGASATEAVTAYSSLTEVKGSITVSANSSLPEDLTVNLKYDPSLIDAFNSKTASDYKTLPGEKIKITNGKISTGGRSVTIQYNIDITDLKLAGDHYLVPLAIQKDDMEFGEVSGSEVIYLDVAKSLSGEYTLEVIKNERTRNIVNKIWDASKCQRGGDANWSAVMEYAQYGFGGDGDWYAVLFSVTNEDMPGKANCKKIEIYTFLELLEETGGTNKVTNNQSYFNTVTGEVYIDCSVYESWFAASYKETYSFKRK